jgi:pimeloyl-ACP methyl ester carboxylesterase
LLAVLASALGICILAAQTAAVSADSTVRPFEVHVPEAALVDLRQRIAATRWPDKETVADPTQGVQLARLQELVGYWGSNYDWRKVEAKLNALPQFTTSIDGVDIHFIHVRSRHPNALAVIITHGWPGSVIEQLKLIGPLADPTAHGGNPEDAFDIVLPSVPGYGFSGKPTAAGWDPDHIARAWAQLMQRLGYTRYVAQGGDWGSPISSAMARQSAAGLLGIHVNLPATVPPEVAAALGGAPLPPSLSEKERAVVQALMTNAKNGNSAYFTMMTARPQTVGYAATDSPAGLAAWVLVHPGFKDWEFGANPAQAPTKDEVLDNITLYWLTNTAASAARLYWENGARGSVIVAAAQKTDEIALPVAITVFPEDVYRAPETWARRAYRNLTYYHEVDKGGHFAAWEQPELFSAELRAAFKPLRK